MRAIMSATPESATAVVSWIVLVMFCSPALHLGHAGPNGGDRFERGLPKHAFGELDVEGVLERQHHVHAGVGGHPGGEEIGLLIDGAGIHGQAAVLGQHLSNGFVHGYRPFLSGGDGRRRAGTSPLLTPTTHAAAKVGSWLMLTDRSEMPASAARSAARP